METAAGQTEIKNVLK